MLRDNVGEILPVCAQLLNQGSVFQAALREESLLPTLGAMEIPYFSGAWTVYSDTQSKPLTLL